MLTLGCLGSIKGDVKKKTLLLSSWRRVFSDIRPLRPPDLCRERESVPGSIGGCVVVRTLCACKQRVGQRPTMVLSETRDPKRGHYIAFVGLSEGAYGAP